MGKCLIDLVLYIQITDLYVIIIPNTTRFVKRGITYEGFNHRRSWIYWQ